MAKYYFYSRNDQSQEPINTIVAISRLNAAKRFAQRKQLSLKSFLKIYAVSK